MTIDIRIVPHFTTLDVHGPPDLSSAYSLSGYVEISLSPTSSFFERPRPERLVLESLELVFEGQSELITDSTGYSAVRLCTVTRELVRGETIELSNESASGSSGKQDTMSTCKWEVVFDIPIPGWLPATSIFGDSMDSCHAGTRYALYATARFQDLNTENWPLSSLLCGLFSSRTRTVKAKRKAIVINRVFIERPSTSLSDGPEPFPFSTVGFAVQTSVQRRTDPPLREHECIPLEVLSALNVIIEAPEHIPMNVTKAPFTLRARLGGDLDSDQSKRIKIIGFNLDVRQVEQYRAQPSPTYLSRYPVPGPSQQPPRLPLRSPHPFEGLYSLGLSGEAPPSAVGEADFSLVYPDISQRCYRVANGGMSLDKESWTKFGVVVNMDEALLRASEGETPSPAKQETSIWRSVRTSADSPFLKVNHVLVVELVCSYDHGQNTDSPIIATETLHIKVPLHYVVAAPATQRSSCLSNPPYSNPGNYSTTQPMKIPAYSQLFYSNGDPREDNWDDDLEPLPMYRKEPNADENTTEESRLLTTTD